MNRPSSALSRTLCAAGIPRPATCSLTAAFLRHHLARIGLRHPNDPGTALASRCQHDHNLHARPESGRARRPESAGSDAVWTAGEPATLRRARIRAIAFRISGRPSIADDPSSADEQSLSKQIEPSTLPRYTAAAVRLPGYRVGPTLVRPTERNLMLTSWKCS